MNILIRKIKKSVVRSPLHKLTLDIKARNELSKFSDVHDEISGHSTVYCISPYKTGTTYLSGSYPKEVSAHEPFEYLSLKELDRNFDEFFIRRLNSLNLKLECSGFFSAYVDELAAHPLAQNLHFIVILRPPSSWITSTVNYWAKIGERDIHFHCANELFWKRKIGVDLNALLELSEKDRGVALKRLGDFYLSFTKKTQKLENVHYVKLKDIDSYLPVLDELIGETSDPKKHYVNANKGKSFRYNNEAIDKAYKNLILNLV